MPVAYFWSFGRLRFRSLTGSMKQVAASSLVKIRSRVELNSTGNDQVVLGLRLVATLMQVSVGRSTLKWALLREIHHKNDVSERPETLMMSSIQRALVRK